MRRYNSQTQVGWYGERAYNWTKKTVSSAIDSATDTASDAFDVAKSVFVDKAKSKAVDTASEYGGDFGKTLASAALNVPQAKKTSKRGPDFSETRYRQIDRTLGFPIGKVLGISNISLSLTGMGFYAQFPNLSRSGVLNKSPSVEASVNEARAALGITLSHSREELLLPANMGAMLPEDASVINRHLDLKIVLRKLIADGLKNGLSPYAVARTIMSQYGFVKSISFSVKAPPRQVTLGKRGVTRTVSPRTSLSVSRGDVGLPNVGSQNEIIFSTDGDNPGPAAAQRMGRNRTVGNFTFEEFFRYLDRNTPSIEAEILRVAPNWRTQELSRASLEQVAKAVGDRFGARLTAKNSQHSVYYDPNRQRVIEKTPVMSKDVLFDPQTPPPGAIAPLEDTRAASDEGDQNGSGNDPQTPKKKPFLKTPMGITTTILGAALVLGGTYYLATKED